MTYYLPPKSVRARRLPLMLSRIAKAAHQYHQFNFAKQLTPARILHWRERDNDLGLWAWPAYEHGDRVPPDELVTYRNTHYFRSPCCLCCYLDKSLGYTESRITLLEAVNQNQGNLERRPFIGEYVAECAREPSCGYFVVLEQFYGCKVLLTQIYLKRAKPHDPNALDFLKRVSEEDELLCDPRSGLRRIRTPQQNDENFSRGGNKLKRIREEAPGELDRSMDCLGHLFDDGVPASDFWTLFVQCAHCGFVMPKYRYPFAHQCPKRPRTSQDTEEEISDRSNGQDDPEAEDANPAEGTNDDEDSGEPELDIDDSFLRSDDDEFPDFLTALDALRNGNGTSSRAH